MVEMTALIPFLPLAGFAIQMFLGRRLPRGGDFLSIGLIFGSLILSILIFIRIFSHGDPNYMESFGWEWIVVGGFKLTWGFLLDTLAGVMLVVVSGVSFLIHLYSVGYMHGDPRYSRYFGYLGIFSFSMLGLVLTDNLFGLYIFWELVGLSSYLLIGFWFEKKSAADAGKKAFITTRVGDVGMFIGIMITFATIGTLGFHEMFTSIANGEFSGTLLTVAGVCLFMGAVGKSAQFPLHVWLPDAMEGPTPVSALIHAATMVAAGVYMVGRLFVVFTPDALTVIAYVGGFTAIFAATIAIVMTDIKRVLAYSTLSQLGYMVMALGVGGYVAGLFHLMTHAFFKALLFLCAGSVIHAVHTQDVREMGGLRTKMPITFWTFVVATLAISGVPPFSGFFSKDAILAATLEKAMLNPSAFLLPLMGFVAAGITSFYMFRLLFLTFFGKPRDEEKYHHAHESPWVMTVPLVILGILSVCSAWGEWFQSYVTKPTIETYATVQVHGEQTAVPNMAAAEHVEAVPPAAVAHGEHEAVSENHDVAHSAHTYAMYLSVIIALSGIGLAYATYIKEKISADRVAERFKGIYTLLTNKYYIDEFYGNTFIALTLVASKVSRWFDNKIIDGIVNGVSHLTVKLSSAEGRFDNIVIDGMVNGVANTSIAIGGRLRRLQTGRVQNYVLWVIIILLVIFYVRVF
ncbi:MAG: NADH-quinone oxidoreductase subunit L [Candidatus Glassbacteria bacterium]